MKNEEPKIRELVEKEVAFVSFTGNHIANTRGLARLYEKLYQLYQWAVPRGLISPETVFLSAYQDDPETTLSDELTLECCMSIPPDIQVDGEIQKKVLPGGKYAVMHAELTGPQEYGTAWNAVLEWIEENNYDVDMSRPSYEVYLNNPEEHPEKHHIVDICMSVTES